jgi:uncharacterized protein
MISASMAPLSSAPELVEITTFDPPVRGKLHRPETAEARGGIVLAHGAGSNAEAPLLRALAAAFARAGWAALRCDLPYRQVRGGPPRPGDAARDRAGLRNAAAAMRQWTSGPVCLGGHSYGGRQTTMLLAEDPEAARALLLMSYPLHPPDKPAQLRTAHFPELRTPCLFFHGSKDPFGTLDEMRQALALIPAPVRLEAVQGAGHDRRKADETAVVSAFFEFIEK